MHFFERDSLSFLFGHVIRAFHHRSRVILGKLGLYQGQPPILFMLWQQDGRPQKEFAEKLGISPATITVMLKRMEKAGLLERRPDPSDLRVSRVHLTDKGMKLRDKVEEAHKKVEADCLRDFSGQEIRQLWHLLHKMKHNLQKSAQAEVHEE